LLELEEDDSLLELDDSLLEDELDSLELDD